MPFLSLNAVCLSRVNIFLPPSLSLSATCLSSLLPSFPDLFLLLSHPLPLFFHKANSSSLSLSLLHNITTITIFFIIDAIVCVCVSVGTMPVANRPIKLLLYSQFLSYSHSNHTHTHTHTHKTTVHSLTHSQSFTMYQLPNLPPSFPLLSVALSLSLFLSSLCTWLISLASVMKTLNCQ